MPVRGVRGATTVANNNKTEILAATKELLTQMVADNQLDISAIATAFFSTTAGLDAEFPAVAARELGWNETPLFCMQEIAVPQSLPNCIRVLLQVNTDRRQNEIKHVYLRAAQELRR